MFARDEIHPGLAVMPAEHGRAGQQRLAGALIDFIIEAAARRTSRPRTSWSTGSSRSTTTAPVRARLPPTDQ